MFFCVNVLSISDDRLKKFSDEKQKLLSEVHMLHKQLDEHKSGVMIRSSFTHGAEEDYETQSTFTLYIQTDTNMFI